MLALLLLAPPAAATDAVPMGDGVTLATDAWVPAGTGPWPTILRRTPYGRALDAATVQAVNDYGYAFVSQDVRGTGGSGGDYRPFFDDADDGAATIAWLTAQGWSDGHVVMYGGSAESIVQLLAAGEGPAGLDAIQPFEGTPDLRASLYPGGAWRRELTTEWLASLGQEQAEAALRANEADGPFWDPVRLDAAEYGRVDAAMLNVAGFFDIFEGELPAVTGAMQAAGNGADTWLVLGPWVHGGPGVPEQGDVRFPDAVYDDFYTDLFALYDWKTRGGARPDWPAVRYVVSTFSDTRATASSVWLEADTWPPPGRRERLYFGADALGDAPDGDPVALVVDPADPVPSVGGGNLTTAAGVFDQAAVDARRDVYVLATAPREAAVTLAGNASATVWAASATTDVDVIARIEVVPASGKAWLVADGIRRGRFVGGEDAIRPLTPGEPARFELDLGPIGVTLAPGQQLRVAVSGTLAPRYEPNPNVAEPLADDPTPVTTTLTLYRDVDHPSSLVLPVTEGTIGGVDADEGDSGADSGADSGGDSGADSGEGGGGGGCGCASGGSGVAGFVGLLGALAAVGRRRSRG